jgi:hypothetical protein
MSIQLVAPQSTILGEIADDRMTRDDVALTYAFCIRQRGVDTIDFGAVNRAIVDRWSLSALKYIKTKAWRYVERPHDHDRRTMMGNLARKAMTHPVERPHDHDGRR